MKKPILGAALVALAFSTIFILAQPASAGPIERACMSSDRKSASPALCSCIQRVADMTLKSGDQRRAAKFFRDPQAAQDVRMSTRGADDEFWDRYRNFGNTAAAYCAS